MRTMDPAIIHSSFQAQLVRVLGFYNSAKPHLSDADVTILASSTLVSAATIWESFVSDLIIAYINRDPSTFAVHLNNALSEGLTDKQKAIKNRYAKFVAPKSIDKATVTELLDGDGNNVTFSSGQTLQDGARRYVAPAHRAGIEGLTVQQLAVMNLWIALRNHIAHDSEKSRKTLKDKVSHGTLIQFGLHRAVNNVLQPGHYLKSLHQVNGTPRIEVILNQMSAIAAAI
jgi:hypothetical protein